MSNPREYLIYKDVRKDAALKPFFDACVNAVMDGTARIVKTKAEPDYPQYDCFHANGREIIAGDVFTYYLHKLAIEGFDYEKARDFSERMCKLAGFSFYVRYPLEQWVNYYLRDPYYYDKNADSKSKWHNEEWILKPDESHDDIPKDFFKFACYIALCHMKFGSSCESVTANRIFGYVTELGSDLPEQMKKHGSGMMPKELLEYKDAALSCKANDAFATIKITIKEESEAHYAKALDFICKLLQADFPHSYSIEFQSKQKNYLPIKGLPKKGVHQFFANAINYAGLHGQIEHYARLAMKEGMWYSNLVNEYSAMPGTFAVFALGLLDESRAPLVLDYLALCDDEHSSIQGKFIAAYIGKFGFTDRSAKIFLAGAGSMQELPPDKIYAEAIANETSLRCLLNAKANADEHAWRNALCAIWGDDVIRNKGQQTLKKTKTALKPLYEDILKSLLNS